MTYMSADIGAYIVRHILYIFLYGCLQQKIHLAKCFFFLEETLLLHGLWRLAQFVLSRICL